MSLGPYYLAIAMQGRFCVAHRLPGTPAIYGLDVDCPTMADAEAVAERMNEERGRQQAAEARERRERGLVNG